MQGYQTIFQVDLETTLGCVVVWLGKTSLTKHFDIWQVCIFFKFAYFVNIAMHILHIFNHMHQRLILFIKEKRH